MKNNLYKQKDISILYVEDDTDVREITHEQLKRLVTTVYVAANGKEGLEIFKNHKVDLIITDINMPEKNGFEMLYDIRKINPNVFAIILSAYNPQSFCSDLSYIDILNDYLAKPTRILELMLKIDQNIQKIKKQKEEINTQLLLEQYKKAMDYSAIVVKTDIDGNITYANDNFYDTIGYSKDEVLGKSHNILKHQDTDESFHKQLWDTIVAKQVWHDVVKNKTKTGKDCYLDTTISPICDNAGNIVEYLAIRFDITDHKRSLEKAQNAEKVKSTFLANMSHEIRTPLNGIIGFLDILNHTQLDNKQKEYVETIKNSSHTLLSIINDILDFSKIEANQLAIESTSCQLKKEIELSTQIFHLKAEENNINFILKISDEIPTCIVSDPLRIKQVITNLVNNAIKFTKKGSVTLDVRPISYDNNKQVIIQFSIQDTGIGIPKDKQKLIFEPFLQTDASVSREFGGTGLGLSITTELVNLLGGELGLKSIEGVGSIFSFIIPLEVCNDDFVIKSHQEHDFNIVGKILIAEDNKTNQKLISFVLKEKNLDFLIVNNGYEAVEEYKRNSNYDIILMDINMPIKDGMEATKEILAFEKENNIKHTTIIALTANALQGDRERFIDVGMDDYLTKPINKDELFDKIARFSYFDFDNFITLDNKEKEIDETIKYDKENIATNMQVPVEFLDELLDSFFDDVEDEITQLQKAAEINDYNAIVELTHSIKGASANLHLMEINELVKEVEQIAKRKEEYNYLQFIGDLNMLLNKYKKANL